MKSANFKHSLMRPFAAWPAAPLLACAFFAGCHSAEKEKEPVVRVRVAPAEKNALSQVITADAVLFPLKQATVSPKITSPIAQFKVQRGSRVTKGQLLAILENRDLNAQAEASKGDFEQADARYAITVNAGLPQQIQKAELDATTAKSAFDAAQKVYDSRKDLYQQGAIPRRDLDSAEVALAQARSQYQQAQKLAADLQRMGKDQLMKEARGTRESAEGHYRAAAAQLSYSEIRSPIDGVVTDRPLYVGDLATANQPILTIMDISSLVAKAHIPQSEAAQLKVGDSAELKAPNAEEPVNGQVSLVSPALDPGSTTVEVWVQTRKPNLLLRPGMTVSIEIKAKTVRDALVVPMGAIFKNNDGAYFVVLAGADQKAHQRPVQLGVKTAELAQIVSGVSAGDSVIVAGGYAIPDGAAIEVEKAEAGNQEDKAASDDKPAKPEGKKTAPAAAKDKE